MNFLILIWTSVAVIGVFFAGWNFVEANKDCKALKLAGVINGRKKIAEALRFQDGIRVLVHAIFIAIGIVAALPSDAWWYQTTARWGLVLAASLLVFQSAAARKLRYEMHKEDALSLKADKASL